MLYRPGRPQTHIDLPESVSWMIRLKACIFLEGVMVYGYCSGKGVRQRVQKHTWKGKKRKIKPHFRSKLINNLQNSFEEKLCCLLVIHHRPWWFKCRIVKQGVVMHGWNPSTWETQAVWGWSGLHIKTLSQKTPPKSVTMLYVIISNQL